MSLSSSGWPTISGAGYGSFPAAGWRRANRRKQAVVREYLEETGFTVEVCSRITTVIHHFTRYKVVLHCFACRLVGDGQIARLQAAQDGRWVLPEELAAHAFPSGHRKLLAYLFKTRPDEIAELCR